MSVLWREKTDFKRLDEEWEDITEILPYERLYETLTPEQLRELLRDAKSFHWQALDLHKCGLDSLPEELGELGELTDLRILHLGNGYWDDTDKFKDAAENAFSTLPDSLGNLINLQWLKLNYTQITALPDSIGNLANLQILWLYGTPLYDKLPPEIRWQSPQEVIRYILAMQSNAPKRYFNETKMVVVGQGSVGKSCFINRL